MKLFKTIGFTLVIIVALAGCSTQLINVLEDIRVSDFSTESQLSPKTDKSSSHFVNYIEQPPTVFSAPEEPVIRGIYVTSNRAGIPYYMEQLLELSRNTDVNAMVIDVRTEDGFVTFKGIEAADNLGLSVNNIPDIRGLIATLRENDIYPIARVVAFKDNNTHTIRPDLYIQERDGSMWLDANGVPWLNPYNPEVWDFVLEFARGAAEVGFEEIQFDYIRFAASPSLDYAYFGDTRGLSRTEIITEFARKAVDTLRPYGVKISADVYGTIINSDNDAAIVGQDYVELARILDVISPMVYPSHYADGSMGLDIPDLAPYDTIYKAMLLSNERLSVIPEGEHVAVVRPWLQDFTATWLDEFLRYSGPERAAQIQGAYDAGLTQWLLWDPSNNYAPEGTYGLDSMQIMRTTND